MTVHGRTAAQSYSGRADWDLVADIARQVRIPVIGSGDCVEPEDVLARLRLGVAGVLVGRGILRNPWVLAQAKDLLDGRPVRPVTRRMKGEFLLEYIDLLLQERTGEAQGFRHEAPGAVAAHASAPARGRERWVINKVRALNAWYSKGFEGGGQLRTAINQAESITHLRDIVTGFFLRENGLERDAANSVALGPAHV